MSTIGAAKQQRVESLNEGDILRTAASIGAAIGLTPRQAYHLISTGGLKSVRRVGGRFFASRSRLLEEITGINSD